MDQTGRPYLRWHHALALIAGTLIFIHLLSSNAMAALEPGVDSKYANLSFITSYKASLYFAGAWWGRLVVVERDAAGQWNTFSCPPGGELYDFKIARSGSWLCFSFSDGIVSFDVDSKSWMRRAPPDYAPSDMHQLSQAAYRLKGSTIEVMSGTSTEKYELCPPSVNAYKRWRSIPRTDYFFEQEIDTWIETEGCLWFPISFYDAEGITGVGGLGMFDVSTKKLGIFRDSLLAHCSSDLIEFKGDTIFLATGVSSEYGLYSCNGLVVINLRSGDVAQIEQGSSPLDGETFWGLKLIGDELWMLTNTGIVCWNLRSDRWMSVGLDMVVAADSAVALRREVSLYATSLNADPTVASDRHTLMGPLQKGHSFELKWTNGRYAEVNTDMETVGWMRIDDFIARDTASESELLEIPLSGVIYKDSALTIPYHHVQLSRCIKLSTSGNAVKVSTHGCYVEMAKIDPTYVLRGQESVYAPRWLNRKYPEGTLKEYAVAEYEREQIEVLCPVPVIDTTITITKGLDLYDALNDLLDCRWMPREWPVPLEPTGIKFVFRFPGEGSGHEELSLVADGNVLKSESKLVAVGDTLMISESEFRAIFAIGEYRVSGGVLQSLTFQVKLFIIPSARDLEE